MNLFDLIVRINKQAGDEFRKELGFIVGKWYQQGLVPYYIIDLINVLSVPFLTSTAENLLHLHISRRTAILAHELNDESNSSPSAACASHAPAQPAGVSIRRYRHNEKRAERSVHNQLGFARTQSPRRKSARFSLTNRPFRAISNTCATSSSTNSNKTSGTMFRSRRSGRSPRIRTSVRCISISIGKKIEKRCRAKGDATSSTSKRATASPAITAACSFETKWK